MEPELATGETQGLQTRATLFGIGSSTFNLQPSIFNLPGAAFPVSAHRLGNEVSQGLSQINPAIQCFGPGHAKNIIALGNRLLVSTKGLPDSSANIGPLDGVADPLADAQPQTRLA